jgi:hypothetical protein
MNVQRLQLLARLGYAARGAVYLLVGGLAVVAAATSGRAMGSKDALRILLTQPLGEIWVAGIAVGLVLFAFWRILQAVLNADHLPGNWMGIFRRLGYGLSAVIYVSLAATAVSVISKSPSGNADAERSAKDWTATVLAVPLGQTLIGGIGAILFGVGIGLVVKGLFGRVDQRLLLDRPTRRWVTPFGRIGSAARGVVFALAGSFLVISAIDASPEEARGLAGSLRVLQAQPFGWGILAGIALGLVAFGLFQFVVAYYRQIDTAEAESAAHNLKTKMAATL